LSKTKISAGKIDIISSYMVIPYRWCVFETVYSICVNHC